MKRKIEELILHAVEALKSEGVLEREIAPNITIDRTRDALHGDFASNLALILAKPAKLNPRQLAEKLIAALPQDAAVTKVELAGPGFINFFIDQSFQFEIVRQIHDEGREFGLSNVGAGKKVQVEFVSANPTGPLHVGHGRGAAYGSVVADLLQAVGFDVHREYYVNDAGRQMDILATSIWLRYLEECGELVHFPSNAYRGEYVRDIASDIHKNASNEYRRPIELVLEDIPADEPQGGDKEEHIDALIARAKTLLGMPLYQDFFQIGLNTILEDIRQDLNEFGVDYQEWFSERQLMDDGSVEKALERLRAGGHLYEQDGATWFASAKLGDEKDRVVVRDNGQSTYFASDIAYHMNKLDRGFDQIIDIWGADHHGYVPRVRAAMQALGADESKLKVLLVQFASLYRGEEKVQMSTRSGEFVTLRQLRNEVGKDAARFFYVMRRSEQHMDFDLKLATSRSNENPVFYVQYAYARVCSVLRQLDEKNLERNLLLGMENLELLTEEHETSLLGTLARYPEMLERAALQYEPHQLIQYLRELATEFHTYYNAHQFLVDDAKIRDARLNLICAVKQVLANGLGLLDINVMARDYKHRAQGGNKKTSRRQTLDQPQSVGLWKWMLVTALIISFVVFLVYLRGTGSNETKPEQVSQALPIKPEPARNAEPRPEKKPEPVKNTEPKQEKKPEPAKPKVEMKAVPEPEAAAPQFDFYTILPEKEVVVPDYEINTRAREERVGQAKKASYIMQAGSFKEFKDADGLRAKLALMGIESRVEKAKVGNVTWNRVKMGPYDRMASVSSIRARLRQDGIDVIVTESGR